MFWEPRWAWGILLDLYNPRCSLGGGPRTVGVAADPGFLIHEHSINRAHPQPCDDGGHTLCNAHGALVLGGDLLVLFPLALGTPVGLVYSAFYLCNLQKLVSILSCFFELQPTQRW